MNDDFKFPSMAPVPLMAKDLTMRDHFAAQALQGLLANIDDYREASDGIAIASWAMADSMLKMRER
jgi:hypothetical protein